MLKIIKIEKNPKRKRKAKKKMACVKRRKPGRKKTKVHKRRKIIRARKNPPIKKMHETMIVGYARGNVGRINRGKTLYFTGSGFSRRKEDAKIFLGDGARFEAKRILPLLPVQIYGIKVEKV